jgi:MYXO-CTERM domain-containing protein
MRKRSLKLFSPAVAFGALLTTSSAFAHIDLIDPPARAHGTAASGDMDIDVNTNQKVGPCGQVTNGRTTDRVTTYAPGQTITVQVREETNHDSYLRVSLDLDGDDDFVYREPVPPATTIPPETEDVAQAAEEALDSEHLLSVYREFNTMNGFVHEIQVTLPNVTCNNCTLQVIQLMFNTTQVYYNQCADLIIAGNGAPAGADAGVGGEGGSANAGEAGAAGAAGEGGAAGAGGAPSSGGTGGSTSSAGTGSTPPRANGGTGGTGAGASAGGSPATGSAGTSSSAPVTIDGDDDGGCTISTHASRGASAGLFGLLALGLGLVVRRKR